MKKNLIVILILLILFSWIFSYNKVKFINNSNSNSNIIAIYINNEAVTTLPKNIKYYVIDYGNGKTKCYNSANELVNNVKISINPLENKLDMTNVIEKLYCDLYLKDTVNTTSVITLSDKILKNNTIYNESGTNGDRPNLQSKTYYDDNTTGTIYWTSTNTESLCENGDVTYISGSGTNAVCKTFYFAGYNENNLVWFANRYWRIIRINEDGSVRLIDQGDYLASSLAGYTLFFSPYSSTDNDNSYVGWMYGTAGSNNYNSTHTNTNQSTIMNTATYWARAYLDISGEKYLSKTAIFCNDRSLSTTTPNGGYGTTNTRYGAYDRLNGNTVTPQFKCPRNEDKFTESNETGNGVLSAINYGLVGLITADEATYAGVYYKTTTISEYENYLIYRSPETFFTMTPYEYDGGAKMYAGNNMDGLIVSSNIAHQRLVINLKSCVQYTDGTGTRAKPYKVTISEECELADN